MKTHEIKEQLEQFHCPRWDQLPDFELYMDQVLYFVNDRFRILYFEDEKDILTSNMINNYVKNSIVHPPERKHYKQYHLAFLIVVTILKRCYSLSDISKLIEIEDALVSESIERVYNAFASCFQYYVREIVKTGTVTKEWHDDHETNDERDLMIRVVKTVVFKMYTELEILEYEEKEAIG